MNCNEQDSPIKNSAHPVNGQFHHPFYLLFGLNKTSGFCNTQRPPQAIREYCTTTIKIFKGLKNTYIFISQAWSSVQAHRRCINTSLRPASLLLVLAETGLFTHQYLSEAHSSAFGKSGYFFWGVVRAPSGSVPFPYHCQQLSPHCISDMY